MVLPHDDTDKDNPGQPAEGQVSPLPDWLKPASPPETAQPAQPLPGWMKSSSPGSVSPPSDLPAWLASEAQPVQTSLVSKSSRPAESAASEPTDDLAALRASMAPLSAEDAPGWLAEIAPGEPASDDMPAWLSEVAPSAPTSESTPDWLNQEVSSAESAAPPAQPAETAWAPSDDMPDWLSEVAPSAPTSESTPDWLNQEVSSAESAAPPAQPAETAWAPSDDMPDWLSEVASSAPASEGTPDWLTATSAGEPAAPPAHPAETTPSASADMPDWLSEVVPAEPSAPLGLLLEPTTAIPAEALDWLADVPPGDLASVGMSDLFKETPPTASASSSAQPVELEPADSAEVPDWLSSLDSAEPPAKPGEPAAVAPAELPDWMSEVASVEPDASLSATIPSDAIDWLSGLKPLEPSETPELKPEEPASTARTEATEWLSSLPEPGKPAERTSAPSADMPDWLSEVAPSAPASGSTPDWLKEASSAEPTVPLAQPSEAPEVKPQEPASDASDWLSSLPEPGKPSGRAPEAVDPLLAKPASGPSPFDDKAADDLFDWMSSDLFADVSPQPMEAGEDLLGMTSDLFTASAEQGTEEAKMVEEAETVEETAPELEALPDWWQSVQPSAAELSSGISSETSSDLLDQINSLRFDAIVGSEAQTGSMEPEKVGALKDVVGVIQPEVVFEGGSLKGSGLAAEAIITDEQSKRIERLRRLLEAEKEEISISPQRRLALPLLRWLVTAALAAAIAAPVIMEVDILPAPQSSPGAMDADQLLSTLPNASAVLVAFEYEPESAAELQPLAVTLLRHIGSRSNGMIYAVSTKPLGPAMANSALNLAFPTDNEAPAGSETEESGTPTPIPEVDSATPETNGWVNLGYVPGGANGISELVLGSPRGLSSRLAFDFQGRPTGITQAGLIEQPPALIVIVSAKAEDLRPWVEQAGQAMETPILAAISAGSSPLALPYRHSGQVDAVLIGVGDTLSYQSMAGGSSDPALVATWNAQALGGLIAAGAIIVGGLFYGLTSWRKPQEQGR